MQGTNIINQRGVYQLFDNIRAYLINGILLDIRKFTFILSSFLSYTYASFLVFGFLDALENTFVQPSTTGTSEI